MSPRRPRLRGRSTPRTRPAAQKRRSGAWCKNGRARNLVCSVCSRCVCVRTRMLRHCRIHGRAHIHPPATASKTEEAQIHAAPLKCSCYGMLLPSGLQSLVFVCSKSTCVRRSSWEGKTGATACGCGCCDDAHYEGELYGRQLPRNHFRCLRHQIRFPPT